MHAIISLEDALKLDNPIYIDMRSPAEYENGRIPGAINVPLFDDLERSQVGTIYKIEGPDEAKKLGLTLVSGKLPEIVSQIRQQYKTGRTVIVYCWRGGMRSKAVVSVLELMGIPARQLLGGYKNYRRYILDSLENFATLPPIVVLCGSTGVGKTTLLTMLSERGLPVIDLEKLANHRGSAFGQVGLGRSATAQNFDAALLAELQRLQNQPFILVECESKRIGNVYLPNVLYQAMQHGRKILAHATVETRVSRLMEEYLDIFATNRDEIAASLSSLKNRLGIAKTEKLLTAFAAGQVRDVVRILLVDYYDILYGYEKADPATFDYIVDAENLDQASCQIIDYLT
ncbi:MAG: tRNA 2-selenouridine(34) synthase MnmH [Negativicutes bacterium]|nr:tRNA 2-selenouridine(34) synthase MnmH [Negativicutes bacterium]